MEKGARDGPPQYKSGSNGVCLEFYVGYFLCFKTKKVTNLPTQQVVEVKYLLIRSNPPITGYTYHYKLPALKRILNSVTSIISWQSI